MNGKHPKRGIALLFVISLIVLFFLFATTFVAMSSSYMRSTRQRVRSARLTQYKPNNILDTVFMMVLRDLPENAIGHPLQGHSLLADQYDLQGPGFGSFVSVASDVSSVAAYGNTVALVECVDGALETDSTDATVGLYKDAVVGRWLTFVDGPCRNQTFPIIDYQSTDDVGNLPGRFYILLQPTDKQWVTTPANMAAMGATRFVVNGRPFDGYDFKSNPAGTNINHRMANEPFDAIEEVDSTLTINGVQGGMRFNRNLFLARNQPNNTDIPEDQDRVVPSFHRYDEQFNTYAATLLGEVGSSGSYTYQQLIDLASTSLRPTPWANPNFTGSNPFWEFFGSDLSNTNNGYDDPYRYRFSSSVDIGGQTVPFQFDPGSATHWAHYMALLGNDPTILSNLNLPMNALMDVDNDGDGIKDSIWLDLGLAPIVMKDGTRVKPLVAIQIEDMDGRVNINSAGTLAHTLQPANANIDGKQIPFGQGYGPAEILLSPFNLNVSQLLAYRYGGTTAVPLSPDATFNAPLTNGLVHANLMGVPETHPGFDPTAKLGSSLVGDSFGTPGDYQGQFIVTSNAAAAQHIDFNGNAAEAIFPLPFLPHHQNSGVFPLILPGPRFLTQYVDNPYDYDVFNAQSGIQAVATSGAGYEEMDLKFSSQLLEVLLRPSNSDALHLARGLRDQVIDPNRKDLLAEFDNGTGAITNGLLSQFLSGDLRKQLTTESYEVPAVPFNVAQVLREILIFRSNVAGLSPAPQAVDIEILGMLGPELVSGLPLDANRLLGNGRDDDGDQIFDEPGELQAYEYRGNAVASGSDGLPDGVDQIMLDMNNDGIANNDSYGQLTPGVRQVMARNLYVLMLTLFDKDPTLTLADLQDPTNREVLKFRTAVAQWAINAVDFRDPDSISSPFEFDLDPFDGWHADGDLTTDAVDSSGIVTEARVWGLERPDLLLTESRADHQHRSSSRTATLTDPHHQAHLPNASAFFEIYNPWLLPDNLGQDVGAPNVTNPKHQQVNNDVGGDIAFGPTGGEFNEKAIDLSKVTPNGGHPIFRVMVVKDDSRGRNPDHDISAFDNLMEDHVDSGGASPSFLATDIERTVYFVDPSNLMNFISSYTAPTGATAATPSDIQLAIGSVQHFPFYDPDDYSYTNRYLLRPGHHAVVGSAGPHSEIATSAFMTIFGRDEATWVPNSPLDVTAGHLTNRPYIRLEPDSEVEIGHFDASGATTGVNVLEHTVSVPLNAAFQGTVTSGDYLWNNFDISSPLGGYLRDSDGVPLDSAGNQAIPEVDGWRFQSTGAYTTPFAVPGGQDESVGMYGYNSADEENWNRHIVLQRLANPELDFDPLANPYITLDDLDMQITASGGLGKNSDVTAVGDFDGRYTERRGIEVTAGTPLYGFNAAATDVVPTTNPTTANLWLRSVDGKWASETAALSASFANLPVEILSGVAIGGDVYQSTTTTLGRMEQDFSGTQPMTWLTFNNRPFISEAEMELVPIQSNALLLEHMIWPRNETGQAYNDDIYRNVVAETGTTFPNNNGVEGRIPSYLPNFFAQQTGITGVFAGNTHMVSRRFSQLFEFLDVPSRFVGTRQLLDPVLFSGDDPTTPAYPNANLQMPFSVTRVFLNESRSSATRGASLGSPSSVTPDLSSTSVASWV